MKTIKIAIEQAVSKAFTALNIEMRYKPYTASHWPQHFSRIAEQCFGKTLLSTNKLYMLYQYAIATAKVAGDIAEAGVYTGGSAKMIALTAIELLPKRIFLLDTFEGLPDIDIEHDTMSKSDLNDTSFQAVKDYLAECDNIIFLPGLFKDTFSQIPDKRFSLVHIDADIYPSIKECCEFFYPRLWHGGVMLFDDYDDKTTIGAKKAIDEFFADKPERVINLLTGQCMIQRL
jgi:O-methyltransferase